MSVKSEDTKSDDNGENDTPKTIVVCGGSGKQGKAVIDALLRYTRFNVRLITRNPEKNIVKYLKNRGVEIYKADYNDKKALYKAFRKCYGVFVVTNFWEDRDIRKEIKQGMILTDVIERADIKHCVWSCLEDTRECLGDAVKNIDGFKVPHFDGKATISKYMQKKEIPVTYLYTSFYWENLLDMMKPIKNDNDEYVLSLPMEDKKLAGVSVNDIGKMAASIFLKGPETIGEKIGVVGEYISVKDMMDIISRYSGKKYIYNPISNEEYRKLDFPGSNDLANMFIYYTKYEEEVRKFRNKEICNKFLNTMNFNSWANKNFNKNRLTFFNRPGNVEPIRILLYKANVSFYDNRFRNNHDNNIRNRGNDDIYDFQLNNDLPFGYIPLYEENNLKISNTGPILRYIADKYNYNGENDYEKTKLDTLVTLTDSSILKFYDVLNSTNDNDRYNYRNNELGMLLSQYDKILNENQTRNNLETPIYFSGNKVTYGDAVVYNFIKTLISSIKNLRFPESVVAFYRNFENYLKSDLNKEKNSNKEENAENVD